MPPTVASLVDRAIAMSATTDKRLPIFNCKPKAAVGEFAIKVLAILEVLPFPLKVAVGEFGRKFWRFWKRCEFRQFFLWCQQKVSPILEVLPFSAILLWRWQKVLPVLEALPFPVILFAALAAAEHRRALFNCTVKSRLTACW